MYIRIAKAGDLEQLVDCFIDFNIDLLDYYHTDLKRKSKAEVKATVKRELSNRKGLYLIAEYRKEIIGFGYGSVEFFSPMIFKDVKYGKIFHLWIRKNFRGNGLSTKFTNRLLVFFKKHNCKYVELGVLPKNPAKKIYTKWGFRDYLHIMRKYQHK